MEHNLTVKDLIALLQTLPPDAPVEVRVNQDDGRFYWSGMDKDSVVFDPGFKTVKIQGW